jgi:hypothetical protein
VLRALKAGQAWGEHAIAVEGPEDVASSGAMIRELVASMKESNEDKRKMMVLFVGGLEQLQQRTSEMFAMQSDDLREAQKQRIEFWQLLGDMRAEAKREALEQRREERKEKITDELLGTLKLYLPQLANYVLGGKVIEGAPPHEFVALCEFLSSLAREQVAEILRAVPAVQGERFMELYRRCVAWHEQNQKTPNAPFDFQTLGFVGVQFMAALTRDELEKIRTGILSTPQSVLFGEMYKQCVDFAKAHGVEVAAERAP